MLGVDEPAELVRRRVANLVPVLQLICIFDSIANDSEHHHKLRSLPLSLHDQSMRIVYRNIFCSFVQTSVFLASSGGKAALERHVFSRAATLEATCQLTVPNVCIEAPQQHYYMNALLLRVAVCSTLINEIQSDLRCKYESDSDVQHLVYMLQLFVDTHLDLYIYCVTMGNRFDDAYLEAPTISSIFNDGAPPSKTDTMSESVLLSPLERCYPHPLRAAMAGEMIDLTGSTQQANVWTAVRNEIPLSKTASFLHVFMCKAVNHKCLIREFHSMMSAEIGKQPALLAMLMNLLQLTMLGNYPGAKKRPLWRTRMVIRHSFTYDRHELHTWCAGCHEKQRARCPKCNGNVPKPKDAAHREHLCDTCSYLQHNKHLVFGAVKEFWQFTVRCDGLLNMMLEQEAGWIEHCRQLNRSLDDARGILTAAFADERNADVAVIRGTLKRVSQHLQLMHDCNKPTMTRLNKTLFTYELILAKLTRIHNLSIVEEQWPQCQQPQDFLLFPLLRDRNDPLAPPGDKSERFYVCNEPLPHLNGRRWCDVFTLEQVRKVAQFCATRFGDIVTSLLSLVGMSPVSVRRLRLMHFKSEVRDMPDNKLSEFCEALLEPHATDFHLLHYFLRCLDAERSVYSFRIDDGQRELQERALRLRHHLLPWEPLPPGCDSVWVCRNDQSVFADTVEAATPLERELALEKDGSALSLDKAICSSGVSRAYYDHDKCALVCANDHRSTMNRKMRRAGQSHATTWMSNTPAEIRLSNSIRLALENQRACSQAPLEKFSLLGRVVKVGKVAYTLCVKCGSTCRWQESCMTSYGIVCGREVRFASAGRYTALQRFVSVAAEQVRDGSAAPDHLIPLRETLLVAPRAVGDRSDIFTRVCTPVFDSERVNELLSYINAKFMIGYGAGDRLPMLTNSATLTPARVTKATVAAAAAGSTSGATTVFEDVTYLVVSELANSERRAQEALENAAIYDKAGRGIKRTRGRLHKAKEAVDDDVPSTVDDIEAQIALSQAEKNARNAVPSSQRHRVRPAVLYDEEEWQRLKDDEKMFAWMPEGRRYRIESSRLASSTLVDVDERLRALRRRETERITELRAKQHYKLQLEHLKLVDESERVMADAKRSFHQTLLDPLTIDDMRRFFTEIGALEIRTEVRCAFCRSIADPKGRFICLNVVNSDRVLIDPRSARPLEELGIVRIFLCANEFRHVQDLLLKKSLPLAVEVFQKIAAHRARATEQFLRKGKRFGAD